MGAVGVPVNAGLTFAPSTNSVVASCVLLVPPSAVGAVGMPTKCGELVTKAVVANCEVDVPAAAVGAVGTPENAGLTFSPCTNAVVAS